LAVEYIRDVLKVDQVVGQEMSQVLIEGDVIVPESKPDIGKILDVSGAVVLNSKELIQDRVMVEGGVRYNIIYTGEGDDELIDNMEDETGFTHYIEIPGAKPGMMSVLKCEVEHIEYEIVNSRKLNIKTVLNMDGKVSSVLQLEAVQGFRDLPDVQVLKDRIKVVSSREQGSSQSIVREDLELEDGLPSIQKILKKDAHIKIKDKQVADNRVIIQGDINIRLLYSCEDQNEPIQNISYDMPFTHTIDIMGAYQGMDCSENVWVQELFVEPREDINGELRILSIEAVISGEAQVFETDEQEILVDAYCPGMVMEPKNKKVKLTQVVDEKQDQTVIKEVITFPDTVPRAEQVLHTEVRPVITDQYISDERVIIEGVLVSNIIYRSADVSAELASLKEDIPFRHSMDVQGITEDMDCSSQLMVEHVSCSLIAPDQVELRAVVAAQVSVFSSSEQEVMLGVDVKEAEDLKDSGIYIYFVQPGDSLWSVAKKYNTTTDNILKFNNIEEPYVLHTGDKLLIYKKLEVTL